MHLDLRLVEAGDTLSHFLEFQDASLHRVDASAAREQVKKARVLLKPGVDTGHFLAHIVPESEPLGLEVRILQRYGFDAVIVRRGIVATAIDAVERLLLIVGTLRLHANVHDFLAPPAGAKRLHLVD